MSAGPTQTFSSPRVEDVYGELAHGLRRFFRSKGVGAEDAADLAQETVERAFLHVTRHGMQRSNLWPLACTIGRNLYIERIRRARPQLVPLTAAETVADTSPAPDETVVASERRRRLGDAIAELQPRHRRVLEMNMSGMSPAEIASQLGIKRNAADALLYRARRTLASKLGPGSFGFIAGPLLRLRLFARRAADAAVVRFDHPWGLAAATVATSVALAAAVGLSPAFKSPRGSRTTASADVRTVSATLAPSTGAQRIASAAQTRTEDGGGTGAAVSSIDVGHHRVGGDTGLRNPTDPSDNNALGFDVWHRRDPGRRGVVGPVADSLTDRACDGRGAVCSTISQ